MSAYPEHDKLTAVQDEYNAVRDFLEWAGNNGLQLCRMQDSGFRTGAGNDEVVLAWTPQEWRPLVSEHFELEHERRAMLAAVQSGAAAPVDDTAAPDRSWWISWYGAGAFEYHGPWWITGYEGGGAERAAICAAVQAPTEDAARQVIADAHDSPLPAIDWRFIESRPRNWSPFTDRFQRADWMQWGSQDGGA